MEDCVLSTSREPLFSLSFHQRPAHLHIFQRAIFDTSPNETKPLEIAFVAWEAKMYQLIRSHRLSAEDQRQRPLYALDMALEARFRRLCNNRARGGIDKSGLNGMN